MAGPDLGGGVQIRPLPCRPADWFCFVNGRDALHADTRLGLKRIKGLPQYEKRSPRLLPRAM